ncbi:hypothetical protein ACFYNL_17830 [Streptomyces sp. NPDC007808]
MKRRVVAALAVAMTALVLSAALEGPGRVGSDDWNIFLTNVLL